MKTIVESEHYTYEVFGQSVEKVILCEQKVVFEKTMQPREALRAAKKFIKTPHGTITNSTISYE